MILRENNRFACTKDLFSESPWFKMAVETTADDIFFFKKHWTFTGTEALSGIFLQSFSKIVTINFSYTTTLTKNIPFLKGVK